MTSSFCLGVGSLTMSMAGRVSVSIIKADVPKESANDILTVNGTKI